MVFSHLYTYTHRLDALALRKEERRIALALRAGGLDPTELDFGSVAAEMTARDLKRAAKGLGIEPVQIVRGKPDRNGNIEVRFGCATETEAVALKIVLG